MNDLDTLRPEVREALDWFVARRHFGTNGDGHLKTIRAELLRLAALEHAWQQWIKDGMRVDFLPPEPPK